MTRTAYYVYNQAVLKLLGQNYVLADAASELLLNLNLLVMEPKRTLNFINKFNEIEVGKDYMAVVIATDENCVIFGLPGGFTAHADINDLGILGDYDLSDVFPEDTRVRVRVTRIQASGQNREIRVIPDTPADHYFRAHAKGEIVTGRILFCTPQASIIELDEYVQAIVPRHLAHRPGMRFECRLRGFNPLTKRVMIRLRNSRQVWIPRTAKEKKSRAQYTRLAV